MFRTIVLTACLVGLVGGVVLTGLEMLLTAPIILEAEKYEGGGHAEAHAAASETTASPEVAQSAAQSGGVLSRLYHGIYTFQHKESDWEPADGWQRNGSTLVADILIGIGFGLLLTASLALRPEPRWKEGLLWGLGGYLVFFVLPGLGLEPEIPGSYAADLAPRQAWWVMAVFCSGVGLALITLQKPWAWKIGGALLILLPHFVGAPQPLSHGGAAPAELAEAFIWRTALVNAVFWLVLGSLAGWTLNKLKSSAVRLQSAEPPALAS
ncbi:MAG: CbtA family protein [Gammaproteobacteria bacterium]|nr:CbtA family protein [Gammaproteobacteria bacterium]